MGLQSEIINLKSSIMEEPMLARNDGKIVVIVVVVVMVLVCAVAGVAVLRKKSPQHSAKDKLAQGPSTMVSIGELIVNLADTAEIRYLKTDTVLEVQGKMETAGGEGEGGDAAVKAPLRDAMIGVLSSKRFVEINRPGGKDVLKTEIAAACNKRLKDARVVNVYFNEFAMQ
jgi:flagellar FliL protein